MRQLAAAVLWPESGARALFRWGASHTLYVVELKGVCANIHTYMCMLCPLNTSTCRMCA